LAIGERLLIVDKFANEGQGLENPLNFSLDDPQANLRNDAREGRIRITPGAQQYPNLAQEQIQALLEGRGGLSPGLTVKPSISDKPDITPFPLGCPSGFYQSGNVCIPIVGTYPDSGSFNPAAGHETPKAVIKQILPPTATVRNQEFYIQCFFQNTGSFEGKFFLKIKIPSLSIESESTGVHIPAMSNGLIYKRLIMPANAPGGNDIPATGEVSHLDEKAGVKVTDDTDNFNIPAPTDDTTTVPPITTQDCYTVGTKSYCRTNDTNRVDCLTINNARYCTADIVTPSTDCYNYNSKTYCRTDDPNRNDCVTINNHRYCTTSVITPVPTPTPTPTPVPDNTCFTITIPNLMAYQQRFPSIIIIRNIQVIISVLLGRGLNTQTTSIRYCKAADQTTLHDGCVSVNNVIYCPTSTHDENSSSTATISLNPSNTVVDGQPVQVVGSGFAPNESIVLTLIMTAHALQSSRSSYEGRVYPVTLNITADSLGGFRTSITTPTIPSGVTGNAIITAQGRRSFKNATKSITVT